MLEGGGAAAASWACQACSSMWEAAGGWYGARVVGCGRALVVGCEEVMAVGCGGVGPRADGCADVVAVGAIGGWVWVVASGAELGTGFAP